MESTSKRLYTYIVKQKGKIWAGIIATLFMGLIELFTGSLLKTIVNLVDDFSGSFKEGASDGMLLHVKYKIDLSLIDQTFQLINKKLKGPDEILKGMILICLLFVGIYFLLALTNYARRVFMNAAAQRILQNFKTDIYEKVLRLPFSFFSKNKTGDIVSRITYDVTTLNEIIELFVEVARAGVYILVFIPVMFSLSWQLTVFAILFFPASVILIDFVTRKIKRVSKKITDNVGSYTAFLEEKINHFKTIKTFRTEKKEAKEFSNLVEENYQHNLKLIKLKFSMNPTNDFLSMLALSVVFIFYSFQLTRGQSSLGEIAFFIYLVRTLFKPVKKVAEAWGRLHVALVSTRKIFHLMDEAEEMNMTQKAQSKLTSVERVEFKDVCFKYTGNQAVLLNLNLELKKGDIAVINGKTGSGKSTLLKLLPGFYVPQEGNILLNRIKINDLPYADIRRTILLADSDSRILNGTIQKNIEYGGHKLNKNAVREYAQFIGLESPDDLQMIIGKDGIDLSEGQKQKLVFLRAIHHQPSLLILDEVFSLLDPEDISFVMKKCQNVNIVIVVSRNPEVLKYATKTLILENSTIQSNNEK